MFNINVVPDITKPAGQRACHNHVKDSGIFFTFLLAFLLDLIGFLLLWFANISPPKSLFFNNLLLVTK